MDYYHEKDNKYFSNVRLEIINLVDNIGKVNILEIGAAGGDTLITLKKNNSEARITGIELFHLPDSNQKDPLIDKFIIGNIEQMDELIFNSEFDFIICGDVLEHLLDPWKAVEKISKWLKKGGKLIVSIPNIRDFESLYKIVIKGDFRYADMGVLDKTHFRFFCKKNIKNLVQTDSLKLEKIISNCRAIPYTTKRKILNNLTLHIFEDFLTAQYLTVSVKL